MGRLEDIIERNQHPRRKAPAAAPARPAATTSTEPADRLQKIIERNQHPYRNHKLAVQIPAILLLVVLGLLAFTNAAAPPVPAKPKPQRVHDVPLLRTPK